MNELQAKLRELELQNAPYSAQLETLSKELAKRLYNARKALREQLGERPYGAEPMNPVERLAEYGSIRSDPERLSAVLAETIRVKPDGRVLLPKRLAEAFRDLESQYRQGTL